VEKTPENFCACWEMDIILGLKHINYTYQEGEGGIAEALGLAEDFADGESICVVLGDNIIETTCATPSKTSKATATVPRSC